MRSRGVHLVYISNRALEMTRDETSRKSCKCLCVQVRACVLRGGGGGGGLYSESVCEYMRFLHKNFPTHVQYVYLNMREDVNKISSRVKLMSVLKSSATSECCGTTSQPQALPQTSALVLFYVQNFRTFVSSCGA